MIVRAFIEKTKAPAGEIDLALQRTGTEAMTKISDLHRRFAQATRTRLRIVFEPQ